MPPTARSRQPREQSADRSRPPTHSAVGRPRSFSADELIAAALTLGPDGLSLADVADTLGVPRSTVYNHVASPAALGALVFRSKLDEVRRRDWQPPPGPWTDALIALVDHSHEALLATGPWIRFYDIEVELDVQSLKKSQAVLSMMVEQGVPIDVAGRALELTMSLLRSDAFLRASFVSQDAFLSRAREIAKAEGLELMLDLIPGAQKLTDDERFRQGIALAIADIEFAHQHSARHPGPGAAGGN